MFDVVVQFCLVAAVAVTVCTYYDDEDVIDDYMHLEVCADDGNTKTKHPTSAVFQSNCHFSLKNIAQI